MKARTRKRKGPGHLKRRGTSAQRRKTSSWAASQALDVTARERLFHKLDAEFGFTLDVCGTSSKFRRSAPAIALKRPWVGVCWLDAPATRITRWLKKAFDSVRNGATVVCLVPAWPDTMWWHEFVMRATEIRFLPKAFRDELHAVVVVFRSGLPRKRKQIYYRWPRTSLNNCSELVSVPKGDLRNESQT